MALKNRVSINHQRVRIGQNLSNIRTQKKISVYQICKNTGLSRDQIISIESGQSNYTSDSLIAYLLALGLSLNEYLDKKNHELQKPLK